MKHNIIYDVILKNNLPILEFDNWTNEIAKILKYKKRAQKGKLVIVTSMSPTPVGEGKTTTSIGLVDGLNAIGVQTIGALREPSLGPVFGMKGTGSGSNKAKLLPFDKINLHFTGDLHAITTANNLIAAVIENEIYHHSSLNINPHHILWKRCLDINDRGLRDIKINTFNKNKDFIQTSFNITAASDLMALFCLARNKNDFVKKLSQTIVAMTYDKQYITIKDLQIEDAIIKILEDAFAPNLVRTMEDNPIIVHGGPFANIAHGCSSLISLNTAQHLADITITECGFGSDLGLEKFMNITCQEGKLNPDLIVLVISLKSILYNGENYGDNVEDKITAGFANILHHIKHCQMYNVPLIVAINHRSEDKQEDIKFLNKLLDDANVSYSFSDAWAKGSKGTKDLATKVHQLLKTTKSKYKPLYKPKETLEQKIAIVSKQAYGANKVVYSKLAQKKLSLLTPFDDYYVCISKNPYSLTCDPKILGKPIKYNTQIEDIEINHAARLIIPITSVVFRMPGLPKQPIAKKFKI